MPTRPKIRGSTEGLPVPSACPIHHKSDKPARTVITPSKQTIRTSYPSSKSRKTNDCESGLESRAAACIELSPGVLTWAPQPFTIRFFVDGEIKKYTPDFQITLKSERVKILEVKPLRRCLEELMRSKLIAAQCYFESIGVHFEIVTEEDMGSKTFCQNLNLLRYYMRVPFSEAEKAFACKLVAMCDHLTMLDLEEKGIGKSTIYSLLANNILSTDLTIALNPNSNITLFSENDNEKCYFNGRSAFDLK